MALLCAHADILGSLLSANVWSLGSESMCRRVWVVSVIVTVTSRNYDISEYQPVGHSLFASGSAASIDEHLVNLYDVQTFVHGPPSDQLALTGRIDALSQD